MKIDAQRAQRGFGVIAAIVVLVVLAALAAAIVRFGSVAQSTSGVKSVVDNLAVKS